MSDKSERLQTGLFALIFVGALIYSWVEIIRSGMITLDQMFLHLGMLVIGLILLFIFLAVAN